MKLREGNYALCIAHPGHELRLHGFLERTLPWLFILADEGTPSRMDRMQHYLGFIFKNTGIIEKKRDAFYIIERKNKTLSIDQQSTYVKDAEMQNELLMGNTSWFEFYINRMANTFIKDDIDHVVVDASEEMDPVHEINRVMTEIAIKLVKKKKGKQIDLYEFNVLNPFDSNISHDCIRIELNEKEQADKIKYVIGYHEDIFDELSQNIPIHIDQVKAYIEMPGGYEKLKNRIFDLNPDFFKYEYIRPVKNSNQSWLFQSYRNMIGKPLHGKDYNKVILPIKKKLEKQVLKSAIHKK